jgi:hypothetical protein
MLPYHEAEAQRDGAESSAKVSVVAKQVGESGHQFAGQVPAAHAPSLRAAANPISNSPQNGSLRPYHYGHVVGDEF